MKTAVSASLAVRRSWSRIVSGPTNVLVHSAERVPVRADARSSSATAVRRPVDFVGVSVTRPTSRCRASRRSPRASTYNSNLAACPVEPGLERASPYHRKRTKLVAVPQSRPDRLARPSRVRPNVCRSQASASSNRRRRRQLPGFDDGNKVRLVTSDSLENPLEVVMTSLRPVLLAISLYERVSVRTRPSSPFV